jgi:hypothetical protein
MPVIATRLLVVAAEAAIATAAAWIVGEILDKSDACEEE